MAGLTIGIRYLTGYAVATDPASRQRAEWPPHPARVFMALAAAHFEDAASDQAEREALLWLEGLRDPSLMLPDQKFVRSCEKAFVPVNDDYSPHHKNPSTGKISFFTRPTSLPLKRRHAERTYPRVRIGDEPVHLLWREADATKVDQHRPALERLVRRVTRIGHSSSLVQMWLADPAALDKPTFEPDPDWPEYRLRQVRSGALESFEVAFNAAGRERATELRQQIDQLKAEKKAIKGKGSRERKQQLDEQIAEREAELAETDDRPPRRPHTGLWTGYSERADSRSEPDTARSLFDSELLILRQTGGPRLPVTATLPLTQALRDMVMKHCPDQPPPAWISGHTKDGGPEQSGEGHLAVLPLPFAGYGHADGHLMGMALAFPRAVSRRARGRALSRLVVDENGQPETITLTLGKLGTVQLKRDMPLTPLPRTLQRETWTAPAHTWATATPIVLDRFAKTDRGKDREGWSREVADIIAQSCDRIGLPPPAGVDIDRTSWLVGSPRAASKRRAHRDASRRRTDGAAPLGDGFPAFGNGHGKPPRPQVHAWLRFDKPVRGPVMLGAGRYRGYGLCKPLDPERPP